MREQLDEIGRDIDKWTKNAPGLEELIRLSTKAQAESLITQGPDYTAAAEYSKEKLQSKTSQPVISATISFAHESPFFDNFRDFYEFPRRALVLARYILPHSLTARYPIEECDFRNLILYRQHEDSLRDFFEVVNAGVEDFLKSVGPFIETSVLFKSLRLFSI